MTVIPAEGLRAEVLIRSELLGSSCSGALVANSGSKERGARVEVELVEGTHKVFSSLPYHILKLFVDGLQADLLRMPDANKTEVPRVALDHNGWFPSLEEGSVWEDELAAFHFLIRRKQAVHQPCEVPRYPVIEHLVHVLIILASFASAAWFAFDGLSAAKPSHLQANVAITGIATLAGGQELNSSGHRRCSVLLRI